MYFLTNGQHVLLGRKCLYMYMCDVPLYMYMLLSVCSYYCMYNVCFVYCLLLWLALW